MSIDKSRLGSSFDSFLEEEGIHDDVQAEAVKRAIVCQITQFLEQKQLTKAGFAQQIDTSRTQLSRILDPHNTSLNLNTMSKIASAMGKKLEVRFV